MHLYMRNTTCSDSVKLICYKRLVLKNLTKKTQYRDWLIEERVNAHELIADDYFGIYSVEIVCQFPNKYATDLQRVSLYFYRIF